ncbi:MAG: hypothetical protein EOO53_11370 [Gammaproteobacteria bacterium]|nr:MAG: hypothetical protein EOO53_11370 [Gammaproteobacteria bacterium]
MSKKIVLALSLSSSLMAACGGGSGGASSPAPAISSSTASLSSLAVSSASVAASSVQSVASSSLSSANSSSSLANSSSSSSASGLSFNWLGTGVIPTGVELYNIDGYAALGTVTTGGGVITEDNASYRKVTTPAEFIAALTAAKIGTKPAPVKVIEIMNDLNLGTIESGLTITGPYRAQSTQAQLHPTLKLTGLSLIDIQKIDGLTIFSQNGATIRHAEWNVKDTNNLIIRNLKFDEMWEWDEATKGDYDKNDWDYITLGDGTDATKVWIDHCTFYKSYDGIVDIKGASNGVTISWSQILPGDSSNGAFIKAQMDYLEANKATMVMYNKLRAGGLTQEQITQVASTVKKGHLIGATEKNPENTSLQVTLHHNYYKDLQDRMPRLRGGDVQVFNLYADSANARVIKSWLDPIIQGNTSLAKDFTGSGAYHFGITSNGTISTEDGVIEVANSLYVGVLTPLRNNQADVSDATFTGSVAAVNTQHELLATDIPVASQQSTYSALGNLWAVWKGDSSDSKSTLGPVQATRKALSLKTAPPSVKALHQPTQLRDALVDGAEPAGAGKITLTVPQWLNPLNVGGVLSSSVSSSSTASVASAASSSSSSTNSSTSLSSSNSSSTVGAASSSSAPSVGWNGGALVLGGSTTSVTGNVDSQSANAVSFSTTLGKFESAKEAFYFVGEDVTGDFTFIANLSQMSSAIKVSATDQYRVGIMLCVDCSSAAASANAQIGISSLAASVNSIVNSHRLVAGAGINKSQTNVPATVGTQLYFKIERVGSTYKSYYSTDGGVVYLQSRTGDFASAIGSTVKIGFFAATGEATANTISFSNISLTQ